MNPAAMLLRTRVHMNDDNESVTRCWKYGSLLVSYALLPVQ